jgi:hypothetical protein
VDELGEDERNRLIADIRLIRSQVKGKLLERAEKLAVFTSGERARTLDSGVEGTALENAICLFDALDEATMQVMLYINGISDAETPGLGMVWEFLTDRANETWNIFEYHAYTISSAYFKPGSV